LFWVLNGFFAKRAGWRDESNHVLKVEKVIGVDMAQMIPSWEISGARVPTVQLTKVFHGNYVYYS